jgi:hypothetical protein
MSQNIQGCIGISKQVKDELERRNINSKCYAALEKMTKEVAEKNNNKEHPPKPHLTSAYASSYGSREG